MLRNDFDKNSRFCGRSDKITIKFKESISMELATDEGSVQLAEDFSFGGGWKLMPLDNLTVRVLDVLLEPVLKTVLLIYIFMYRYP